MLEKFHYKAVIGYEDHGDYMEIFVSLIQNAMPKATRDEREMLMTGIDLDTWNREFNEEDQPNGQ